MSERLKYDERYSELDNFFSSYFNPFWKKINKFDGPPSDRGVIAYVAEELTPEQLHNLQDELRTFLTEPLDDKTLADVLVHDFACAYSPAPCGITDRQWLHKLDEYIDEELSNATT